MTRTCIICQAQFEPRVKWQELCGDLACKRKRNNRQRKLERDLYKAEKDKHEQALRDRYKGEPGS